MSLSGTFDALQIPVLYTLLPTLSHALPSAPGQLPFLRTDLVDTSTFPVCVCLANVEQPKVSLSPQASSAHTPERMISRRRIGLLAKELCVSSPTSGERPFYFSHNQTPPCPANAVPAGGGRLPRMARLWSRSGSGRGTHGVTGGVVNRATTIRMDSVAVPRALPLSEAVVAIESVFRWRICCSRDRRSFFRSADYGAFPDGGKVRRRWQGVRVVCPTSIPLELNIKGESAVFPKIGELMNSIKQGSPLKRCNAFSFGVVKNSQSVVAHRGCLIRGGSDITGSRSVATETTTIVYRVPSYSGIRSGSGTRRSRAFVTTPPFYRSHNCHPQRGWYACRDPGPRLGTAQQCSCMVFSVRCVDVSVTCFPA